MSPVGPWMNSGPDLPSREPALKEGALAAEAEICRSRFSFRQPPASGFTLIELMVVMLLITIVLAVAIPRLDSGLVQDPQKRITRWMVNSARTLRTLAVEKRQIQALMVDLDENRLWAADAQMDEEALAAAAEKAFTLPDEMKLAAVVFPDKDGVSSGTVAIRFYPGGYADQAMLHVEYDDTIRFAYKFEPLLPKVKRFEEWASYE